MEIKMCRICGEKRSLDDFGFRDKKRNVRQTACKTCLREYYRKYRTEHLGKIRESGRKYVRNHREEHRAYNRQWNKDNLEKKREWVRKKMQDDEYREKINKSKRDRYHRVMSSDLAREERNEYARNLERKKRQDDDYRARKNEWSCKYRKDRASNDPVFRAKIRIRNLIRTSLFNKGYTKSSRTYDILGCDYETLWQHLKQSWLENYGQEWNGEPYHIDHIMPLSTAKTEQEAINLCHYTNLQLLTPFDNMSKHDRITKL